MKKVGVLLGIVILLAVTAYAQQSHPATEVTPGTFNNGAGGTFKFLSNTLTDYYKFFVGPAGQEQANVSNTFSIKMAKSTHYCEEYIYPDLIWHTCNGTNGTIQGGGGTNQLTSTPGLILPTNIASIFLNFFDINIFIFDDFNWESKTTTDPGGDIIGTVNFKNVNGGGVIHVSADGSAAGTFAGTNANTGTASIISSVQSGSNVVTVTQTSSSYTVETPTGTLIVNGDGPKLIPKDPATGLPLPNSAVNIGNNPANLGTAQFHASVGSASSLAFATNSLSINGLGGIWGASVGNLVGGTAATNTKGISALGAGFDTFTTNGPNGLLNSQFSSGANPLDLSGNSGITTIQSFDAGGNPAADISASAGTFGGNNQAFITAYKNAGTTEAAYFSAAYNTGTGTSTATVYGGSAINLNAGGDPTNITMNGTEIRFWTNGSTRVYIGENGKVGIGTNNPITMLDIINATLIIPQSTPPYICSLTYDGAIYYDSDVHRLCFCDSVNWVQVDDSITGCS
ncbi:Uncharacterised protein [uncultured archaeon]|nr:Uncharacterised protein [uncultured archaeon]